MKRWDGRIQCDSRALPLADRSVHCVVTSPPYWGLRDYKTGKWTGGDDPKCNHSAREVEHQPGAAALDFKNALTPGKGLEYVKRCGLCGAVREDAQIGLENRPEDYVAELVGVFQEVRRVLRDDGTVWLNLGDTFWSSGGSAGALGASGAARGIKGQGDRPEAADPARFGRWNRKSEWGLKAKDLVGIPWRVAFALQADGWLLRSAIVWEKPNCMPESVDDRPTQSHEFIFILAKSGQYYYDAEAIKEPASEDTHARYARGRGPSHKYSNSEQTIARNYAHMARKTRAAGVNPKAAADDPGSRQNSSFSEAVVDVVGTRHKRSVWTVPTVGYSEAHYATFPPDLVEPCILAGTSAHGVCGQCQAPWVRIVGEPKPAAGRSSGNLERKYRADHGGNPASTSNQGFGVPWSPSVGRTLSWRPSCACNAPPGVEPDDLDIIESPINEPSEEPAEDASLFVGRAGFARERQPEEGRRPMTRFEQRAYARQLAGSPNRDAMREEAGSAFDHYTRVDRSGARAVPPRLLSAWLDRGWLQAVEVPAWSPPATVPALVLDPFAGSNVTGLVAEKYGRRWIACDLGYQDLQGRRLAQGVLIPFE